MEDEITEFEVVQAMLKYGGGFVRILADLYMHADDDNKRRIKNTWPEYWEQYTELARIK